MLNDGDKLIFGKHTLYALATPGHTNSCTSFKVENMVFTGDTLFSLGCGRVFEGTHVDMLNSLNKLKILPHETKVYCDLKPHDFFTVTRKKDLCVILIFV